MTSVPSQVMRARSMAFCSSRMLPGHGWRRSRSTASRLSVTSPLPILAASVRMKCVGEEQHVVAALPERRQVHVEDAQPVEEIVAEPAGRHLGRQIAVGGGDEPDIGLERRGPPDPLELSLLQHAEQLDLDRGGELADLVEEERAVGRQLEAPGLLPVRPGEGAALVAEQLGLEQRVGQRRAVDRHEGAVGARAGVVDGAGDQLLPRPALPGDQHGGLGARHLGRPGERLAQERGAADDLLEPVALVELAAGTLQALLERPRAALDGREPALLLGQPLVLDGEDHPARDDAGDLDVDVVVPVRLVLAEEEHPPDLVAEVHGHPETALVARR